MAICVCRYPLVITDKRYEDEKVFISFPLEVLDGTEIPIPDIEAVEEKNFDGKMAKYVKVKWKDVPENAKRYNVNEHIVIAGCPENKLQCDTKSIYAVYHPLNEWNDYHMLEINELK